jgi:hypothetical protein
VQRYTRPVIHRVKQLPTHRQLLPKVPKNDDDDESNPQPPPTIRSQQQAHKYAGAIPYYNVMDAVGSDLGIPQYLFDDNRNLILDSILKARTYVHDLIDVDNRYRMVRDKCRNKHANCAAWAVMGYCKDTEYEDYMIENCSPVCETCEQLHLEAKCKFGLS